MVMAVKLAIYILVTQSQHKYSLRSIWKSENLHAHASQAEAKSCKDSVQFRLAAWSTYNPSSTE